MQDTQNLIDFCSCTPDEIDLIRVQFRFEKVLVSSREFPIF